MKRKIFLTLTIIATALLLSGMGCEKGNLRDLRSEIDGETISSEMIVRKIQETEFLSNSLTFTQREKALVEIKKILSKAQTADMLINVWVEFSPTDTDQVRWVEFTGIILKEVCNHLVDNVNGRLVVIDRNYVRETYVRIISNPYIRYIDGCTESKWLERIRELIEGTL